MKIVNLIENNIGNPACIAQHGLSFYFETKKHKVLVDSGADASFLENAKVLGLDLTQVDVMILSHGHYDHAGGILGFADLNPNATIYMQSTADGDYYAISKDENEYIGIDKEITKLRQVQKIDGNLKIDEELSLFSGVTGRRGFSKSNLRLKEIVGGDIRQDSFLHEQYLVVEQEGKKYLFSGCAHNGILNILDCFREIYGCDPDVVISGFHYMKKTAYSEEEVRIITDTAKELAKYHTQFFTCHCTGIPAYEMMKPIMGEKLHMVNSGDIIEFYPIKKAENVNTDKIVPVVVPGSKSITNRALLIAAMANGKSTLKGCLTSEDATHFLECIRTLGFPVEVVSDGQLGGDITITGFGGDIPNKKAEIYVGSAGTAARFLVAMLAFSQGDYVVNSSNQMKKRPMQPLIETLRNAGAFVECMEEEGHFPLHIVGIGKKEKIPEKISVNIDKSSQFLSALLIAAGTFGKKTEIEVVGSHGLSYVDLTADMMKSFGVSVIKKEVDGQVFYELSGTDCYHALTYDVEPDMSAAAYFYALAAILGAKISVSGVREDMLQGDTQFLDLLEKMGCRKKLIDQTLIDAQKLSDSCLGNILLEGPAGGKLKGGFTIDMSAFSDQALTLAAIAPFADAPISIVGIGHIRLQECDRIRAIVDNLTAMGIQVEEKEDAVTIYPGLPHCCDVATYDDHRVAMSFALTGLRTEGIYIMNPACCKKTFAQYFDVLEDTLKKIVI